MLGNIELVLFPRTWKNFGHLCKEGSIIFAEGKMDANSAPPKVLVDVVRTEIDIAYSLEETNETPSLPPDSGTAASSAVRQESRLAEPPPPPYTAAPAPVDAPPPPEAFPPDWEETLSPAPVETESSSPPPRRAALNPLPSFPAPPPDSQKTPRMITIFLRANGNPSRDIRRLKNIHNALIAFPGKDKFSFQIRENGRTFLIDFPNETTQICPEMLEGLKQRLGGEAWRIEPLLADQIF